MNCCGRRCVSIITLIIAVVIFIQTNLLTLMIFSLKSNGVHVKTNDTEVISYVETEDEWRLVIPKLNVSADIKDGTSGDVINYYIGHFGETPKDEGNVGLIAASAGYKENYFEDLDKLIEGDVIIYIKGNLKKEYKVITNVVINQTDWSYLSSTDDNRLTLITGILEKPENRRCVQAIEVNY